MSTEQRESQLTKLEKAIAMVVAGSLIAAIGLGLGIATDLGRESKTDMGYMLVTIVGLVIGLPGFAWAFSIFIRREHNRKSSSRC